jgi:hypothetical protein
MRNVGLAIAVICINLMLLGYASAQEGAPHKFDEFGDINCEDEMARLDNFAIQLQKVQEGRGYILVYGGRFGRRGEARARASRMKSYLTRNRGVDARRITTIDGGYRQDLTVELWLLPPVVGAPSAVPDVALKAVKFKKGRIKKREYYHCGEMY